MKSVKYVLLLVGVSFSFILRTQELKLPPSPRIGLCLSGGGAKGLAHIGLLKVIDSLGIKIDYITGTSMGSIIGGLYACGYSGKQIDSIARTADWDVLLNQFLPMSEINMDEKDEYNKYMMEVPIKNLKPRVTGIIEGQPLINLLTRLTRHVSHIRDFKELPIPFKCMAVDIVSVKPVVLDSGSLVMAMRSSMAIPTVFKPVEMNGQILVDGGLMVNFPVSEVKAMGANLVIGSYTGGRLMEAGEINSFMRILLQTSSFYGIREAKSQIEQCAIFNNLTENMKEIKAGEFKKHKQIMEIGDKVAHQTLLPLTELANQLQKNQLLRKKQELRFTTEKVKVDSVIVDTLKGKYFASFVNKRFASDIKKLPQFTNVWQKLRRMGHRLFFPHTPMNDSISYAAIEQSVRRIYGTRNFYKVYYHLQKKDSGSYNLIFKLNPDEKLRFKMALHYDTEQGSGIVANITGRAFKRKNTRMFLTLDIAEQFKARFQYRKYRKSSQLSYNLGMLYERSNFRFLHQRSNIYQLLNDNFYSLNSGHYRNLGLKWGYYRGVFVEYNNMLPKYPTGLIDAVNIKGLQSLSFGYQIKADYNTLDNPVIPKKGIDAFFLTKLKAATIQILDYDKLVKDTISGAFNLNTNNNLEQTIGFYAKFQGRFKMLIPLGSRLSILEKFDIGINSYGRDSYFISDSLRGIEKSAKIDSVNTLIMPTTDAFYIGGINQRAQINAIPFQGLKEKERSVKNFASLQIGLQVEVVRRLFLTPSFTYLYYTESSTEFWKYIFNLKQDGKIYQGVAGEYSYLYTYGLQVSYRSPIGPILFNFSKVSGSGGYQAFLSLGYTF